MSQGARAHLPANLREQPVEKRSAISGRLAGEDMRAPRNEATMNSETKNTERRTEVAATASAEPQIAPQTAPWAPSFNPWLIAAAVMLATFMEVLDTTIVNVSLRHIAGNLAAGEDEATWVLTSYLVSNAIVLPASAWFSKYFGRKRFLMVCVII